MSRPTIIINELDAERIDRLLEKARIRLTSGCRCLNAELDRAQMCTPESMPHDVVTMNSQVKFRNLTTGEELTRTLVYPAQMTDSSTQLSVLAPVGAALLGCARGYHQLGVTGRVPHPLEVLELLYQPEAAGDYLR
jgi:regulator of nucleoside diphosphate kinase